MRKNHKLLAILFTVILTVALSGLTAVGQSQSLAPYEKQFVSLWEETYTQLLPVRWGGMSPQEVSALQLTGVPFFLLDVRTPTEFQTERIAGAVNIPLDQLPTRLSELPTDREMIVVVYCKVGQRGGLGFALLRQFGYVNTKNMIGGLNAWKTAGLPVDTTPVSTSPPNTQPTVLAPYEKQFVSLWDELFGQIKTAGWGGISVSETNALLLGGVPFVTLDVRTPTEFASGHIQGAVNIPLDQLPTRLNELPADPETIIVVYCKVAQRGGLGFSLVRQLGYVNAKNMIGGLDAWRAAGYPVEP
jgi:rhodanese-related sulfurtransferase